jgi:type III pantothenate kinase
MSTLLIDAGNSRTKWAELDHGRWTGTGVSDHAGLAAALAGLSTPNRVVISNVAGHDVAQVLQQACADWGVTPELIRSPARQCGVSNGYAEPERLGSDRWAALVAAWHIERRACLVVNCGTATTVDALSEQGEFLGGLILPGIALMQHSLLTGTAQLRAGNGAVSDFPRTTADAIISGAIAATVGAILHQYTLLARPDAPCLLSGGAADLIDPYLEELPLAHLDHLVLHGLQLIAEESET